MKDDYGKMFFWILGVFIVGVVGIVLLMTFFACGGMGSDCAGGKPVLDKTPIAVPPVATVPPVVFAHDQQPTGPEACRVLAATLVDAWGEAGYPQTEPFQFPGEGGKSCEGTASDVRAVLDAAGPMDRIVEAGVALP